MTAIAILPKVFSRYQSTVNTNPNINVAFFVINTQYQSQNVVLSKIMPSDDPYLVNFSVSNNDGTNRLGVNATYDLKIVTTTNLPLEFELYRNQVYSDNGAVNIISNTTSVAADEDGTYFKTLVAPSESFSFTANQTFNYQLVIRFPRAYMSYSYQDIVESIEIVVDSKQVITGDDD